MIFLCHCYQFCKYENFLHQKYRHLFLSKHSDYRLIIPFLVLIFFSSLAIQAQESHLSSGTPFIRNFSPADYGAEDQNWAIAQDQNGIMYVGNNKGVLQYDGVTWQLIETENKTVVRSLAADKSSRVYVGAYGEFGYLSPNATGILTFTSLLPQVDSAYRDFADVWQTLATTHGVYFCSQKYLFRWHNNKMRVWATPTYYLHAAAVNDQLYIRQWKAGLMRMESDSLILLPGGEQFNLPIISKILPYPGGDGNHILICTQNEGLFVYDGVSARRLYTDFDQLLNTSRLYQSTRLSDGSYAFGTIHNGIMIMDERGKLRQVLDKSTGLRNNTVWDLFEDNQGGLWIAMDAGLARAELSSPLSYFDNLQGVEGSVLDLERFEDILYIATSRGVYYLDESNRFGAHFKPVEGIPPQCFDLLNTGQKLLGATFQGTFEIHGNKAHSINHSYAFSLSKSELDSNRVYVGLQNGLKSIYRTGDGWRDDGVIGEIDLEIRDIFESKEGMLWATTRYQGILQLDLSQGYTSQPEIVRFDTLHGLPEGDKVTPFHTPAGLRFITPRGISLFDESSQRFITDTALIDNFSGRDKPVIAARFDSDKNLWLLLKEGGTSGRAIHQENGHYIWDETPLLRTQNRNLTSIYSDPDSHGITWFGSIERLIRYDAFKPKDYKQDFRTLIRRVLVHGDSVLYGGNTDISDKIIQPHPELSYSNNSLRFMFAAPAFDEESANEYQYKLEGYNNEWSGWSSESWKDFTNLREGEYRFLVRAKNIYNHIGQTAEFEFRILPPFYRTWWAYLSYGLVFCGLILGFRNHELNRLKKRHQQEMDLLAFDKLKELDQLKSRFFADISHEFRTPLTLILGPMNKLLARNPGEDRAREYHLVKRNAQRLLRLINQLLDLSRLESGKMKIDLHFEDILPMIKGLVHSFESLTERKGITMSFESNLDSAWLYFDREKMEQVLTNLISNAIKFTGKDGKIDLKVGPVEENNWLQIEISDSGSGISDEQLPHIFDRFYQAASSQQQTEAGSGIGLALCKELTELHQGYISVWSKEGVGSRFQVHLPYGEDQPKAVPEIEENTQHENTILLVEDNPDMRAYIREAIRDEYLVIEAQNGEIGVNLALENLPDLIISDVMMPQMDGLELCDILKKDMRSSHIPLMLLTAKSDISSRLEGLERGADEYLAKPFNRQELLLRIRNLLAWRQRLRERYQQMENLPPTEDKSVLIEDAFLVKVKTILEEELSNAEFDIDNLSRTLGMSRSQLFRKVKALTGYSPSLFIRGIRLNKGKELLENTSLNVSEVAYQVGFSTPAYFSDAFTEMYGIRPSQLKN